MRTFLGALCSFTVASVSSPTVMAQTNQEPLRIGAIVDMTGVYSGIGGRGGVAAVKLAAQDFGGKVLGRPIEIVSADYQGKADITSTRVRQWYDRDNVAMVIESTDSASALALQRLVWKRKK